ncbi:hypothetical protein SDC9_30591 [bioreactor metagenome]|uniref:Uncharacterized protein n=1 Tax=bioreactor metagenome TaxID=1076179 RepID=A0A644UZX6_9ZZZZ
MAGEAERQGGVPGDIGKGERAIEMGEERVAARGLPSQRGAERLGGDRDKDEVAFGGEMLRGGLDDLGRGGKVDEAVGEVDGGAGGFARGAEGIPFGAAEDLVNQHVLSCPQPGGRSIPRSAAGGAVTRLSAGQNRLSAVNGFDTRAGVTPQ